MAKLLLIVLVGLIGEGLCQRVLPKGFKFECQPKEGEGILGMFEDMSKLNGEDYGKMLKYDSLRKVAEAMNGSMSDLKAVRDNDAYKKFANYTCSEAHLNLDFYMDNTIEFVKYLLKEFAAKKPTPVEDKDNLKNFRNLTATLFDETRQKKIAAITLSHALEDKSINATNKALRTDKFDKLVAAVMTLPIWTKIQTAINKTGIPANEVLGFTQYYAQTFWKRNSASTHSVSLILYLLCAFYAIKSFKLF